MPNLEAMHPEAYLRLERAQEHIEETREAVAAWANENQEYTFVRVEGSTATPYWPKTTPPERIGILVGETMYNLRAALDYLVFRQAIHDSGQEQQGTQFPIASTPEKFAEQQRRFLKGVSDKHVELIESFQPYHGDESAIWIREFSNLDKHRAIPLLADVRGQTMISVGGTDEDVARLGGVRQPDGAVHYPATTTVTFENGAPVVEVLEELAAWVRGVVDAFIDLDPSRAD